MAVVVSSKRKLTYAEYALIPEERQVTVNARPEEGLTELKSRQGQVTSPLAGGTVAIQQIW